MAADDVLVEVRGPMLGITLNRTEKLNAVTPEMHDAMHQTFERFAPSGAGSTPKTAGTASAPSSKSERGCGRGDRAPPVSQFFKLHPQTPRRFWRIPLHYNVLGEKELHKSGVRREYGNERFKERGKTDAARGVTGAADVGKCFGGMGFLPGCSLFGSLAQFFDGRQRNQCL